MVTVTLLVAFAVGYASWHDLATREIPDAVPLAVLALALVAGFLVDEPTPGARAAGFALGAALGVGLFALGAWGGGDAKLVAALGAFLGWDALLPALIWMGMAGFVLSLVALARRRREVVYGPAIAVGAWAVLLPPLWAVR